MKSPLQILRDSVSDPKNNGDYVLHLEGEELREFWFAVEEMEKQNKEAKCS